MTDCSSAVQLAQLEARLEELEREVRSQRVWMEALQTEQSKKQCCVIS
jgi:hypothetical protein